MKEEIQSTSHNINPKKVLPSGFSSNLFLHFCLLSRQLQKSLEIIRIELHLSRILPRIAYAELRGKFQVGTIPNGPPVILANYTNDHILNEINQGLIDCQVSLRYFNLLPCMVN